MMIYELTAIVREDLAKALEEYIFGDQFFDLMDTGYFVGADFSRSEDGRYRARYLCETRKALEDYLANEQPKVLAHFVGAFPEGIEISRDIWEIVSP